MIFLCIYKGTKSTLIPAIEELAPPENMLYTVDGGYLFHNVVWQLPATFTQICTQYTLFVKQKYGDAHVVFVATEPKVLKMKNTSAEYLSKFAVENHIHVQYCNKSSRGIQNTI